MKLFKITFAMLLIGTIGFTSCDSEVEQIQEAKQTSSSLTQRTEDGGGPLPEYVEPEDEVVAITEGEITNTNTVEKKAKVNCMTSTHIGSGITHYNACVTASNGMQFNVDVYTSAGGAVLETHATHYIYGGCQCL